MDWGENVARLAKKRRARRDTQPQARSRAGARLAHSCTPVDSLIRARNEQIHTRGKAHKPGSILRFALP
jgi:hypothetical protein